jgi:hypothetical protein
MFGLRRTVVVVLAIVVVAAVAYVVVPQGADSTPTQHPLPDLAAATARLSVPADFVQVKVLDGASCPA